VSQGHEAVKERSCEDSAVKCQQTWRTICVIIIVIPKVVVTTHEYAIYVCIDSLIRSPSTSH
jgi:hypothetical protein